MRLMLQSAVFPLALAAIASPSLAQSRGSVGTILVAHGAGEEWNAHVQTIVRTAETGGPVAVSFLMGSEAASHRFQDAARRLAEAGVEEIVVVPLLVSSHSGHYEQIRYLSGQTASLSEAMREHLERAGIERPDLGVLMKLAPALDDAPQLAEVLADRARALASSPADQALFLVGHGPNSAEDHARWMENLRRVAELVKERTGFRDVKVGLVRDDAPEPVRAEAVRGIREMIALQHELTRRDVVVVPVLISSGKVSDEKIPRDLEGLPVAYSGQPLLPHPALARWIEERVAQTMSSHLTGR